ncbi:MAG: 3-deoxy-manno-octulosonate cytidylyltransferase [Acidobacteria bacterium]|nr:3-deoxy-manno-octulosonate cytidylyltransferase [Acidobacteriota bacterium]MBA4124068.1 3-deoxy-manno-octulosonate cytidylyltransferase [Acidobacteriota bacterium]
MKQRGKNPQQNIIAIIPARLDSTRLPNKLLLPIIEKPLILWTVEQAKKAKNVSRVIVATDSEEILRVVEESGSEAVLTAENHQSGSDRIAEVAEILPENSIIVNVQGDEPLISPTTIEKAVNAILQDDSIEMATTCEPIHDIKDVLSPDVVKVVTDENGFALYFSRLPIPFPREAVKKHGNLEIALREEKNLISLYRKHTGLYVYRREFLLKYTRLKQTNLEKTEMLEQLRALENGGRIKVIEVSESSIGVDTREDFERVRQVLKAEKIVYRKANVEDALAVAKVHVESWHKSFAGIVPQEFLDNLTVEKREQAFRQRFGEANHKMFVAETAKDGIIGFADFGAARESNFAFEAELYAIYLLREFQGKGIGENLFKLCQKEMSANGFNSMYLIALEVSPYKSFYEKMGGKIVGRGNHFLSLVEYKTVTYGWKNLRENYG